MTSVLLVDDDALMRAGLRMILEQTDDMTVSGEAENADEGIQMALRQRPDVVLMDIRMPGKSGIEATGEITANPDPPKVIILTTFELDEYVFSALRNGASGFLLKRTPPEDLLAGIRAVAGGDALLAPSVTRRLIEEFAAAPTPAAVNPQIESLTEREREVLVHIAMGLNNQELGEQLFIAENTVKTHVKRILTKLGARDRVQAVVMAYEAGLVDPGR